mmetsp:Transcript_75492/g.201810  ORF Transcript_75492/g.201810 Transcript_75492/m.201810 type:complete len:241 (-) Transcript_75492:204-926(-)
MGLGGDQPAQAAGAALDDHDANAGKGVKIHVVQNEGHLHFAGGVVEPNRVLHVKEHSLQLLACHIQPQPPRPVLIKVRPPERDLRLLWLEVLLQHGRVPERNLRLAEHKRTAVRLMIHRAPGLPQLHAPQQPVVVQQVLPSLLVVLRERKRPPLGQGSRVVQHQRNQTHPEPGKKIRPRMDIKNGLVAHGSHTVDSKIRILLHVVDHGLLEIQHHCCSVVVDEDHRKNDDKEGGEWEGLE